MKAYPGGVSGGTGVAGASPLVTPTSVPTTLGPMTTIPEEQAVGDVVDTGGTDVVGASEQRMSADAPPFVSQQAVQRDEAAVKARC
eukprot:7324029-Prorocentrum_lima.AAC.1